jgi:hypothetical protein
MPRRPYAVAERLGYRVPIAATHQPGRVYRVAAARHSAKADRSMRPVDVSTRTASRARSGELPVLLLMLQGPQPASGLGLHRSRQGRIE